MTESDDHELGEVVEKHARTLVPHVSAWIENGGLDLILEALDAWPGPLPYDQVKAIRSFQAAQEPFNIEEERTPDPTDLALMARELRKLARVLELACEE